METTTTVSVAPQLKATYQAIPLNQIQASPHQARKQFDEEALRGLAESMRHEGLVEPVVVRRVEVSVRKAEEGSSLSSIPTSELRTPPSDLHYELISGERRLRAAKLLGWPTIEARIISTVSEAEAAVKGLIENVQREDLNPVEEAEAFKEISKLDPGYWTQGKIGEVSGKGRTYVSRSLSLLSLPESIIEGVRRRTLSRDHGIELLRIHNANSQNGVANKIIKGGWSVKQTRGEIDRITHTSQSPKKAPKKAGGEELKDPLSDIWPSLMANGDLVGLGPWSVDYGSYQVMGDANPPFECWRFLLMMPGASRTDMARWFQGMADALRQVPGTSVPADESNAFVGTRVPGTDGAAGTRYVPGAGGVNGTDADAVELQASQAMMRRLMPKNMDEARLIQKEQQSVRLPKNAQEERELEALAVEGPAAVYSWIWGADSVWARKMQGLTWKDLGESDPIAGCHTVLDGVKN